jgi:phospholipase A1
MPRQPHEFCVSASSDIGARVLAVCLPAVAGAAARRASRTPLSLLLALCAGGSAVAQDLPGVDPATPEACVGITSDSARLECYDRALGRQRGLPEAAQPENRLDAALRSVRINEAEQARPAAAAYALSSLDYRWELSSDAKLGTFNLRAYKPVYLLPGFWTNRPNRLPGSPNPENQVADPLKLQPAETKFQLSLKTKVAQGLLFGEGDLWFGYTQSSRWQVFNSDISRPFRETIYEPEAMLVFDTRAELLGWDLRLLGVGLNHQSNGRSLPLSRNWNRVIAQAAFEREDWMLLVRPWWRISEDVESDDNPDIQDYLGRGDLTLVHRRGDQEFALLLRHTLRSGDDSRGAWQFDWSFPLSSSLRGHVQIFDGYGESLIDYNHRTTAFGLGISLFEWL